MKKYSKIFALALLTLGLSSCLKDNMVDDQKYGMINLDANKFIELPHVTDPMSLLLENKDVTVDLITVNLAASQVAQEDITIVLDTATTPDLIAAYEEENETSLASFPVSSKYVFPNGLVVVIPKGSQTGGLKFKLNKLDLNPSVPYAKGFKIVSVDKPGYIIAANYQTGLGIVAAKNQYDGVYSYSGTIFRNSATGPDPALSGSFTEISPRSLITLSPNSLSLVPLWANGNGVAGIDNTYITIDPVTNLVTVASRSNATLKNTPGAVNKYDPATQTFTLAFEWGTAPNTRVTTMTLKYSKARL